MTTQTATMSLLNCLKKRNLPYVRAEASPETIPKVEAKTKQKAAVETFYVQSCTYYAQVTEQSSSLFTFSQPQISFR
jgi:hypothetical protein